MLPPRRAAFAILGLIICSTIVGTVAPVQAQTASRKYGELLKRIPEETDALMLVDFDGLFDSPMGKREHWRENAAKDGQGGLGLVPDFSKAVVALGLDFPTIEEKWRLGMFQLHHDLPEMSKVAAREGGYVEKIQGVPFVWTPRGFSLFGFEKNLGGFVSTTDRQTLARWARKFLSQPRMVPPKFADRAINRADAGSEIVLAFNLVDTVSRMMAEPWLNAIPNVKKANIQPAMLAVQLESIQRAFIEVKVDQNITGTLRIEFDEPVDYARPIAKELIVTALEDLGLALPDFGTWLVEFDQSKKAVELSGRMSVESMRQIMSLGRPPRPSATGSSPGAQAAADPKKDDAPDKPASPGELDTLKLSQAYFRSIVSITDALKQTKRPTYSSTKIWYDRYAKQIEELPILGVDKDLLDWGAIIARTFREMSSGINYYAKNQSYTLAASPNGAYYNGYGGYYANSKGYDQAVIKRQSDARMSVDLDTRWQAIATSISDMRRKMVERYKVDF